MILFDKSNKKNYYFLKLLNKNYDTVYMKNREETSGETEEIVNNVRLYKKAVVASKNALKDVRHLATQLKAILAPETITIPKNEKPDVCEYLEMGDHYQISHMIVVNKNIIKIGMRPTGPTYIFKIVEYVDNFKSFHPRFYLKPPFITFDGKSKLKDIFGRFGKNEDGFMRILHFNFEGEMVYLRHYARNIENNDDAMKVSLKEIGPRLTLSLISTKTGLFRELKK